MNCYKPFSFHHHHHVSFVENVTKFILLMQVEAEVVRLEELKVNKMKELILRKKTELEELRRRTHVVENGDNKAEISIEVIESGNSPELESMITALFHRFYCFPIQYKITN